jgi:hypothetical protein
MHIATTALLYHCAGKTAASNVPSQAGHAKTSILNIGTMLLHTAHRQRQLCMHCLQAQ